MMRATWQYRYIQKYTPQTRLINININSSKRKPDQLSIVNTTVYTSIFYLFIVYAIFFLFPAWSVSKRMSSSPTVFEQQREELVREIAVVSFSTWFFGLYNANKNTRAWNKSSETWTAWIGIWRVLLLCVPLHLSIMMMMDDGLS